MDPCLLKRGAKGRRSMQLPIEFQTRLDILVLQVCRVRTRSLAGAPLSSKSIVFAM